MSKIKKFFNSSISIILCMLMICSIFGGSIIPASALNSLENGSEFATNTEDSPISSEEISNALNNAEIVDATEDSKFILADSSIEISDDYFPNTADISEAQLAYDEQIADESAVLVSENEQDYVGDPMVYYTQKWLNQEYGDVPGYGSVPENGKTGWATVNGLLRALQHELGITSLADNFGPTTSSLYEQNILHRQDGVTDRKFAILQGALWCKGYNPGYNYSYSNGVVSINAVFDETVENAVKQLQADAGLATQDGIVSVNIMKALMSMDSFKLLPASYGSDAKIRKFQQWLNRKYEDYTGLNPCDGVYGRNTNKALVRALQAEEGLPVNLATGNFGNTTKLCCPELPYFKNSDSARKYPGTASSELYSDSNIVSFTKLMQFALYANGFGDGNFDGVFDNDTKQYVRAFQEHHAITVTGKVDKSTWLSLFISCGDKNRSAIAADCATILTKPKADALYASGYRYIGRYLTGTYNGGISKALTREETQIILDAGLHFFPIYQTTARTNTYFTPEQGNADAKAAIQAAKNLGLPKDTIIYFAVDFDAMDYQITSNIIPYFKAVHEEMSENIYKTGIYGARNICTRVSDCGYAFSSFVGDMSTGFSGNLGFKMPKNWAFDQFSDKDQSGNYLSISSTDGSFAIDKDGFSGRDEGVSEIVDTYEPTENDIQINCGIEESDTLVGPTINLFGQDIPLFEIEVGLNRGKNDLIRINNNYKEKTCEVTIGIKTDTTDKNVKTKEYAEIKSLVNALGGKTSNKTWNDFQKLKSKLGKKNIQFGFSFDTYEVGYLKLSYANETIELIEGGYGFIGSATMSLEKPIIPFVSLRFDIIGSVETGLKFVRNDTDISIRGDFEFALEPRIGLQVGCPQIHAYGGISGEISCAFSLPSSSLRKNLKVKFQGKGFIEAYVLGRECNYNLSFKPIQLYPRVDETDSLQYSISQNDFRPIAPKLHTYSIQTGNNTDSFVDIIQIYASPQIINIGGNKMFMLYIDDIAGRTESNRSALMYSIYNGSSWSAPQTVLDDNTADFEPVLYSDGNGGVHILWQNANTTFNENITLEQMAEQMDLCYVHWNGTSFSSAVAITDNNTAYEYSHRIVSSEDNISVVWQQNSENDLFGLDSVNTIYRKQFVNGAWQNTETIATNLSIINSMDTAYIDGTNTIAYSAKTSNDTSTVNDLELFYFDGSQIERLTDDNVPDYSVNFLNNELYWINEGTIVSIEKGIMDTKQTIATVDSNVTQIKVISNYENNKKAIVWEQENENEMFFYGVNYNSSTNSFSSPYPLTTDKGVVRGWDACLQSDGQIELAFCYADYLEEPVNGKPYGTLSLIQKPMDEWCDISVNPIATYTGEIGANKEITLISEVYNKGSKPIEQFEVKIIGANEELLHTSTVNQILNSGELTEIEIPFTLPDSISRTDYKIQIQPMQDEDASPSDNVAVFSVGYADLSVEKVEESRTDSRRQIHVTVKNKGFDSVDVATLQIHSESYDGALIGSSECTNLLPNMESTVSFEIDDSYSISSVSENPRLIYIDLNTSDMESDYANNTAEYYVYPDYTINVHIGTTGGSVTGNGVFAKDSIVQVVAKPNPGFVFQGWYENNVKILDADATYSFIVTRGRTLEAKFAPLDICDIVPVSSKSGVVNQTNKYLLGIKEGGKVQDYFTVTNNGAITQIPNSYGYNNATGSQVHLVSENGIVVDIYTIVILGDPNGDGAVDGFDVIAIDLYIHDAIELEGAYLVAADVNKDGVVDETDYTICLNYVQCAGPLE